MLIWAHDQTSTHTYQPTYRNPECVSFLPFYSESTLLHPLHSSVSAPPDFHALRTAVMTSSCPALGPSEA